MKAKAAEPYQRLMVNLNRLSDYVFVFARRYIPCLAEEKNKMPPDAFQGNVTEYLQQHLTPGTYDFYLSGRSDMIRGVTRLIDARFPECLAYTELFY